MKARVKKFYYEEIEEIIMDISDKIAEIENWCNETEYYKDRKKALIELLTSLENLVED